MTADTNAPLLAVNGVTLQYKTPRHLVTATYRVDFSVHKGDRYVILGPSGCGKSTLLKAVGGFMKPVEGAIRIRGKDIVSPGPDRMMVFQEFEQLMPWKTVFQNVLFPMKVTHKFARAEARAETDAATLRAAARALWDSATHREERYAAQALLGLRPLRGDRAHVPLIEHMVRTGQWWDFVDELTGRVSELHDRHPVETAALVRAWSRDDDLWMRRLAILSQPVIAVALVGGTLPCGPLNPFSGRSIPRAHTPAPMTKR